HLGAVVAAVLHHHAVPASLLRGLHQLPALVDGDGHRHLGRRVLPVAHRGEAHGCVPFPGGGGEDEVQVLLLTHAAEVFRPAGVGLGCPASTTHFWMRAAFSGTMSHTARISTPSMRRKLRTWLAPWCPTPTKPMRTVSIGGAASSRGSCAAGAGGCSAAAAASRPGSSVRPRPAAAAVTRNSLRSNASAMVLLPIRGVMVVSLLLRARVASRRLGRRSP